MGSFGKFWEDENTAAARAAVLQMTKIDACSIDADVAPRF